MKNLKFVYIILFASLFIFGGFFTGSSGKNFSLEFNNYSISSAVRKDSVKVLRVIDGDTIEVSLNSKKETVRLIGIDAPETIDSRRSVECFGKEASEKAKEILDGKTIQLESDSTQGERDKYQRLLRYVFVDDLNFNKLMISEGYAHEYTYHSNSYKYQLEFIEAQKFAREDKKGLWSEAKCGE